MNNTQAPIVSNSFESVTRHQRRGAFLSDISEGVQKCVMAVRERHEPATLTIVLKFDPATADADAISVRDEIKMKLPEAKKANTLFFSTEEGQLVRDNPKQSEMDLKVLTVPETEPLQKLTATQL